MVLTGIAVPGEVQAASLRLLWTDNSDNEAGFKIERVIGGTFAEIATVSANVTSYTDSGLLAGSIYCYQVRAFNSAGASAPSNKACATASDTNLNTVLLSQSGGSSGALSTTDFGTASTSQLPSPGGRWADYRVTLKLKSTDNDSIGVMFRYVDNRNYYRFSWDQQRSFRRLEKLQNGVRTVLDQDAVPYVSRQTYQLEIVAQGTTLEVWIDGTLVFSAIDSSFESGTIALYSWYNQGSVFDDILVEDLYMGALLLWDDFNDGNFTGWTIIDEGTAYAPSRWFVSNGALIQNSNIASDGSSGYLGTYALFSN